jgi:glycosyltransferase involved in cell wall biosynthesis
MRVAWAVYGSLDQTSGGYIYDRLIVEGLRMHGDRVDLVELEPGRPVRALEACDVAVVDELCFTEAGSLLRALPRESLGVLLVHHLSAWELEPAARQPVLELERATLSAADVCIATSHDTATRLLDEGLVRDVSVVEPGADRLPPADSGATGRDVVRLLFVGNLIPRKRVLELLCAFAGATESAELVLIGDPARDPAYAAEVRSMIASSDALSRSVRMTGLLDEHELAAELAAADALVLPSLLEGYGMVVGEALHAGVPVIAADAGAAAKLIERSRAGIVFDRHDPTALGAALRAFVGDAVQRSRLREAARTARALLPTWPEAIRSFRAMLAPAQR